ncbi:uncharacterized protein RHO25_005486 [Cercospora beticola]|uniref:Uncharacterized protein n=1 Tax=Cercospora beticola TaxID=122368 RepID=A0ABZ0NMZ6_CERBT|nr:hypothetical protein RHO25_005486 [Cercospora beticola]
MAGKSVDSNAVRSQERPRTVLRLEDELAPLVNRSGLPFFLEECLANWPSDVVAKSSVDAKELAAVKKAVESTGRILRYANTMTTSNDRTVLPQIGQFPDIAGILAAIKDTLEARREYDDKAMEELYTQLGGVLEFYDLDTLMAHISRAIDVDSFVLELKRRGGPQEALSGRRTVL